MECADLSALWKAATGGRQVELLNHAQDARATELLSDLTNA